MTAAIRADSIDLPLSLHVLSAMVLVGTLVLATAVLFASWRGGAVGLVRLGMRSLLWAALPAWVVMRLSAQWVADEGGWLDVEPEPAWIEIGFIAAEPFLLLLLVATLLTGLELRRFEPGAETTGRTRAAAILVALTLLAYVVAIWAMTTKPT
jgi:hypothetical protein